MPRREDRQTRQRHGHHDRQVERDDRRRHSEARVADETGDAEYTENVEKIAADDVADCDVALTAQGRHQRRRHLGQTRAGGNDGEADNGFTEAERLCERDRGRNEPARTEHEKSQAERDESDLHRERDRSRIGRPRALPRTNGILGPGGADTGNDEDDQSRQREQALERAEEAVEREEPEAERHADHQRHVAAHERRMHE